MTGVVRKRTWITRKGEIKTNWTAYYRDRSGTRHNKAFPIKKAASTWLAHIGSEIRSGVHVPDSAGVTVAEAGRLWLSRCEAEGLERGSLQQYRTHLKLYITPELGAFRVAQLAPPDVEAWRDELLKTLSRRRAALVLSSLKSTLRDAQRRGFVSSNAASATRISANKRDRALLEIGRDIPTKEDVNAILAATPQRWGPVMIAAAFTGLRTGELRGLTWDAVDFAARLLRVRQRADFWGTLGAPKSAAGRREIPMAPLVVNTLREWRVAYPYGKDGIVFCAHSHGARGSVLNHGELWRVFRAAQTRAGTVDARGTPKYRFHALRHFFASLGIEAGFSPKRLQTLLGHASITMTYDVYGHLFPNPEDDHARFAAIERAVTGGTVL